VAAGCGGNVTVSRGFDSREVLPVRDPSIAFSYVTDRLGQDPTLVYTTQADDAGAATYWSLNLVTGEVQNAGDTPPPSGVISPGSDRYTCATNDLKSDGTVTLEITDTTTGAKTDIDQVSSFAGCVHDDGTLTVFRADPATGQQALWTGPYQQVAPVELPLGILHVALYRDDGANQPLTAVVIASPPSQPTGAGLYAIDLDTADVTEVVPPVPTRAAWATGAPQAGSLDSTNVSLNVDIGYFNGHYIYGRTMSDGGTTLFAGPFASGAASELALFQVSASGIPKLPPGVRVDGADDTGTGQPSPPIASWQLDGVNDGPSQLVVWDDAATEVTVCPSSPGAFQSGVLSPDGTHVLFRALQLGGQITISPLQLMSLTPGEPHTCTLLQEKNVTWADFSGDGSTIAWITKGMVGADSDLWTANGDGSNPTKILSGEIAARFIDGTSHLELAYGGDLVWLDVRDPTHFSYVAERLFGYPTSVGKSWFAAGYNYSTQDASGLLGVVDLDTGTKLSISPSVEQYLVVPQTMPVDGGAAFGQTKTGLYHVVYLVRGRNPSSQDGIWLATVQAADLR
jgi:hypothetical protein